MNAAAVSEDALEQLALSWFEELGFTVLNGVEIAPEMPNSERSDWDKVILEGRFRQALSRINPGVAQNVLDEAFKKVVSLSAPSLTQANLEFRKLIADGVTVEGQRADGTNEGIPVNLIDFKNPSANEFVACNQFTVIENRINRRPDIVIFVNGLPIAVLELKNAVSENATILDAFNQIQTYKSQIPSLFYFNELLVISDGLEAFVGSLTADRERFMPWRTIDGFEIAPNSVLKLKVLLEGVFAKERFIDFLKSFVVYEIDPKTGEAVKKIAGYHQFHAVRKALQATKAATREKGNRKAGVVWHTQGSGKSLTMLFYAGALVRSAEMENPTIVVITDRNDLDEQLFGTFCRCSDLIRQKPVQAKDREDLRKLLNVAAGGVIFTTIQKFLPEEKGDKFPTLSERRNIVVVADEAHRSQYGFNARLDKSGNIAVGFAQHLRDAVPNATFIGFTGTPVELTDKNTRQVFGDYVDVYDIQQAVEDKATVPIYYESRLAKLKIESEEQPHLDAEFEEVTEGEEQENKEKLKSRWAQLEAVVGAEHRIKEIAADLVSHFENRQIGLNGGKAMVVCMSRRICVAMYDALVELKPYWAAKEDEKGCVKVVMTGSASDKAEFQPHIRSKARLEELAKRFRKPDDPFQIVIVRDMWLTGFDAPCLHTLYVDKPMRGHGLMQAIARVNRVFKDKDGGLVVDYLGIADQLKEALSNYTQNGGQGRAAIDTDEAIDVFLAKYEVACDFFHRFDWSCWKNGTPAQRLMLLPAAQEHVLRDEESKKRFLKIASELAKAYSLVVACDPAIERREAVAFFLAVRTVLVKTTGVGGVRSAEDLEFAIQQLVSKAISSDGVVDVFAAAGLKKPNIGVLSEEFLQEVRELPQKNLAVELLARLLNDEIRTRTKKNVIQSRSFADMLEKTIKQYQNRLVETAQIIEELIRMAREYSEAQRRGDKLNLTEDELAFYDALADNGSATEILGDEILRKIAHDLVAVIKQNLSIDWTLKESVRARLRVVVKRLLKKYGYPPDKQEKAIQTVLEQATVSCADWAG